MEKTGDTIKALTAATAVAALTVAADTTSARPVTELTATNHDVGCFFPSAASYCNAESDLKRPSVYPPQDELHTHGEFSPDVTVSLVGQAAIFTLGDVRSSDGTPSATA